VRVALARSCEAARAERQGWCARPRASRRGEGREQGAARLLAGTQHSFGVTTVCCLAGAHRSRGGMVILEGEESRGWRGQGVHTGVGPRSLVGSGSEWGTWPWAGRPAPSGREWEECERCCLCRREVKGSAFKLQGLNGLSHHFHPYQLQLLKTKRP